MGYLPVFPIMDAKRAVSCPGSSGKLTNRLLIKDQMVSHYKKIYSAKAAVDCSVPKSMCCSIKYKDQKRREQMRKAFERTSSLSSLSQNSTGLHHGVSHSKRIVRPTDQTEECAQVSSRGSTMSLPRFTTSFHSNQIVYPSQMPTSASKYRPTSELTCRNLQSQKHRFTNSCSTFLSQEKFQSFQDPAQKTYSGDILLKHGNRFTQDKPFTPRTLISDRKSALSSYRYYNPPNRKATEERISAECNRKEANNEGSFKCRSLAGQDLLQEHRLDHTWSNEEANELKYYRSSKQIGEYDFYLTSSRVSPEGMKSPIMRKVTDEEEELMYLEFITDITNDILERGIYTDGVLKRVFERHIKMNKHRLNEDKMRHLVDTLQDDFLSPPAAPVTVLEKSEGDSSVLHRLKKSSLVQELDRKTTDEANVLSFAQFPKDTDGPEVVHYLLDSTINASVTDGTEADDRKQKQNSLEVCNHKIKSTDLSLNSGQQNEEELQMFTVNGLDRQLFEFDNNLSDSFSALAINSLQAAAEQEEHETSVIFSDDEF